MVQVIAKNHLPLRVAIFLTANLLTLLMKSNNSDRPISVEDIFIRLVGSALLYNIRLVLPKYMGIIQLGLGTKGTCELLANLISSLYIDFLPAIKECLSDITDLPQSLRKHIHALFMDLANCYGNINKNVFIQILNDNSDLITTAPYFALVYGAQSTIFFSLSDSRKLLHAPDIAKNARAVPGRSTSRFYRLRCPQSRYPYNLERLLTGGKDQYLHSINNR